jgi:hypothetical protein
VIEGRDGIGHTLRDVEVRGKIQRLPESLLVVLGLPVALQPPEQVRGGDDVAQAGKLLGDRPDVGANAVNLLDDEHTRSTPSRRQPHRQVKRSVTNNHRFDPRCHGIISLTLIRQRPRRWSYASHHR